MISMVTGDMLMGPLFYYKKAEWVGSVHCQISGFFYTVATQVSILFMMLISVDQYIKMKPYKSGYAGFPGYTGGFITLDGDDVALEGANHDDGKRNCDEVEDKSGAEVSVDKKITAAYTGKPEKVSDDDITKKEAGDDVDDVDGKVVIITDDINIRVKAGQKNGRNTGDEELGEETVLPSGYPAKLISFKKGVYLSLSCWGISVLFGLIGVVAMNDQSGTYDLSRFCIGLPLFILPANVDILIADLLHPAVLRTAAVLFLLIYLSCYGVTLTCFNNFRKILARLDKELTAERQKQRKIADEEKDMERLEIEKMEELIVTKEMVRDNENDAIDKPSLGNGDDGQPNAEKGEDKEENKNKSEDQKEKISSFGNRNMSNFKIGSKRVRGSMRRSKKKKKTQPSKDKMVGEEVDVVETVSTGNVDANSQTESDAEMDEDGLSKKTQKTNEKNQEDGQDDEVRSNAETNGSSKHDDDALSYNSDGPQPEEDQIVLQASEMDTLIFLNTLIYLPVIILALLSQCGVPIPPTTYWWLVIPVMSVSAPLNMITFYFNNLVVYERPRDISSTELAETAYDRAMELMNL